MNTLEQQAVFAIAATVIVSFLFFRMAERIKKRITGEDGSNIRNYLWKKLGGAFILGVVPGILAATLFGIKAEDMGLTWRDTGTTWLWVAGASLIFVSLNLLNSRSPMLQTIYPELRLQTWSLPRIFLSAAGWIIYLTAYEYLFRGLLLSSCLHAFGLWPAVTINLALYASLHLPKGLKEASATLPFGALVIYLTLSSGSILPAIAVHCVQAISFDMLCIYSSPEMKFHLKKIQAS